MISAKVVADSKNEFGNRITTMVVTMPRIILAEMNTHRMFSRNTASSRAIPFEKMVNAVLENPFIPAAWQKDHRGMQGVEYITNSLHIEDCVDEWLRARDRVIDSARRLNATHNNYGHVTKQLCNRLLESFSWVTCIITATEWENFFALRCPQYQSSTGINKTVYRSKIDFLKGNLIPDSKLSVIDWLKCNKGQAEIHMMALAEAMWDAYNESIPEQLLAGEWHVPYKREITSNKELLDQFAVERPNKFDTSDDWDRDVMDLVRISTVMCARTSYTVVGEDQKPLSYQRMIEIHDQLLAVSPKHMSPFEHCAHAMTRDEYMTHTRTRPGEADKDKEDIGEQVSIDSRQGPYVMERGWCGNFRGFIQYRKTIKGENITV